MIARKTLSLRSSCGHTLIELMVAIVIGLILVLAAFTVMATFEGAKRTTTAMNDALQSGNFGLYEVDKLVRSSGTGLSQYAALVGYGGLLNYTPTDASTGTAGTTITGGAVTLPAPFANVIGGTGPKLRLVPVVIFPSAIPVSYGSTATPGANDAKSDAVLLMLGGAGFGEVPIPVTETSGPTVASTVGLSSGEWVLDGAGAIGDVMITHVDTSFLGSAGSNVVLPLVNTSIGGKTLANADYIVPIGVKQAANFMIYGVDSSLTLRNVDLLNSALTGTSTAQNVSDDIVMMRAVYYVQPQTTDTPTWTNPVAGVNLTSGAYDYSSAGLLAGTTAASVALQGIKAIRVAMIVRAPLNEKSLTNVPTSFLMFGSLAVAEQVTWYAPPGSTADPQNYRYREIETTIPLRNNGLL